MVLLYAIPALWNVMPALFCKWCSAVDVYSGPWINMLGNLTSININIQSRVINIIVIGFVFLNIVLLYLIGCLYSLLLKKYRTNIPKLIGMIALITYILLIVLTVLSEVGCRGMLCDLGSELLTLPSSFLWGGYPNNIYLYGISYAANSFIIYGIGYHIGTLVSSKVRRNK